MSLSPGTMYLYDDVLPAFDDGDYRVVTSTEVAFDGETHERPVTRYFSVDGPRFGLPPQEVVGLYPPRNGRGPFSESLPQIVLRRRTLPWERPLDAGAPIPPPAVAAGDPPPLAVRAPWVALILFEDGEDVEILQNVPLERVVPADVFTRLGSPANVLCDAVDVDLPLLRSILPSKEELKLLTHVRQVSVEDRELATGSTDGFFSVVIANRLPSPGARCRACLVSLEERSDVVAATPPPEAGGPPRRPPARRGEAEGVRERLLAEDIRVVDVPGRVALPHPTRTRLVLLHTWQFVCEGAGTFRDLMQNLDVAMLGTVTQDQPRTTDTGHLLLELTDRVGAAEQVLYRGPLVSAPLTRDPLGPYHSADQARRVSPETGLEDVSYAAAFEVGRLLAASDRALAQALMQWRRGAYDESAQSDAVGAIGERLRLAPELTARLREATVPVLATGSVERLVSGAGPVADPSGIDAIARAVGLRPNALADTWGLTSAAEAAALLGAEAGALGKVVESVPLTPRPNTTIASVAHDTGELERLAHERHRLLANAKTRIGER